MQDFEFFNPTRIVFGKGRIQDLDRLVPAEARVLVLYGGGSVIANGTLQEVHTALGQREVREFGGIEPNPTYENLMNAVAMVRQEKVDFLLAVGGGSVIDGDQVRGRGGALPGRPLGDPAPARAQRRDGPAVGDGSDSACHWLGDELRVGHLAPGYQSQAGLQQPQGIPGLLRAGPHQDLHPAAQADRQRCGGHIRPRDRAVSDLPLRGPCPGPLFRRAPDDPDGTGTQGPGHTPGL
jgi:hypothetical protein